MHGKRQAGALAGALFGALASTSAGAVDNGPAGGPLEVGGAVSVALTGDMAEVVRRLTGEKARPVSAWRVGGDVAVVVTDGHDTGALWMLPDRRALIGSLFDADGTDLSMRVLKASGVLPSAARAEGALPPVPASAGGAPANPAAAAAGSGQAAPPAIDPMRDASITLGDPKGVPVEVYWDPKCPYCDRLYHEAERLGAFKGDSGVSWHFIPVPALGQGSYLPAALVLQGGRPALHDYMAGRPPEGEPSVDARAKVLLAARHLQEISAGKGGVPYIIVHGRRGDETVSGMPKDLEAFLGKVKQG